MNNDHKHSCFLIGNGTLLIQCAGILLNRGYGILGIISTDPIVISWANEKKITHLSPTDNLRPFLDRQPFDYLFSILNDHILPDDLLELPRKYAINYHDSLLPRYAGNHATSWAIMQQEMIHGITWHEMIRLVDAGDILKQQCVQIVPDETAFTLNVKCYEAAINAFNDLLDDLTSGQVCAEKQVLAERTYYSRCKRPPAACAITLNRNDREIDSFLRSLDFGPYPNPLGLPKLAVGNEFFIVSKIDVLDSMSNIATGTIIQVSSDFLIISTTGHDIALRMLSTINGQPLPIDEFVTRFKLYEGYQFKDLDSDRAELITVINESICKHESFWVNRLSTLQPINLPHFKLNNSFDKPSRYERVLMHIPDEVFAIQHSQIVENVSEFLLAAFVVYLAGITNNYRFDIGLREIDTQQDITGLEVFASQVPLRVDIDRSQDFINAFYALREELILVRRHKTYASDVVIRYPALHSASTSRNKYALPVTVEWVKGMDDHEPLSDSLLTLVISENSEIYHGIYNTEAVDKNVAHRLLSQFTTFLRDVTANPNQGIADLLFITETVSHQWPVEVDDTQTDYLLSEGRPELQDTFVAPRNPVEEVLARIWADSLGLERVGIHDNFFMLGGNSLIGILIIFRAGQMLKVEISLSQLFELPTVAQLAAKVLQNPTEAKKIERTAQLIINLDNLSENEVRLMIDEQTRL